VLLVWLTFGARPRSAARRAGRARRPAAGLEPPQRADELVAADDEEIAIVIEVDAARDRTCRAHRSPHARARARGADRPARGARAATSPCPLPELLVALPGAAQARSGRRVAAGRGFAVSEPVLDEAQCAALADRFDSGRVRSTIDMARHRFGDGC
jgi:hypothetical protein